jgi:hypothetical protein
LKRSYSSLNLLYKKLNGISDEYKSFIHYFITNRRYLTLAIPHYDFLRGIIFIDDLRESFKGEIPLNFNIADLIYLLYDDFLRQIQNGLKKHQEIALYLMKGTEQYISLPTKEKRVMKAVTSQLFEFESIEEVEEASDDKMAYVDIRLKETEIIRGEVLLNDIEEYMKGIHLSVEQIMAIRFLTFINSVKREGNSKEVQKSILYHIKNSRI